MAEPIAGGTENGQARQHAGEFILAVATHGVIGHNHASQAGRDDSQYLVASRLPMRFIDRLQAVKGHIQRRHGREACVALRCCARRETGFVHFEALAGGKCKGSA